MKKYSTPVYQGPIHQRRQDEREEWRERISELAARLETPITRRRYIRHPITGELCELR